MKQDSDLTIVRECQSGNISAFNEIVARHKNMIYHLVYRMLNGSSDVDDVSQEIFIHAFKKIKKFNHKSSFSTWLTRLAVNYCINYVRKLKRWKFLPVGLAFKEYEAPTETNNKTELSEKMENLHEAIKALTPKQRAVIVLHYFEEHSCQEIAEIMDCSIGTVKSRLFHARRKLKKHLKSYLKDTDQESVNSEIGGDNYEMFKI